MDLQTTFWIVAAFSFLSFVGGYRVCKWAYDIKDEGGGDNA